MAQVIPETAIQDFYRRWSPKVFGFCSLLLGDQDSAEAVTTGVFSNHVERGSELDLFALPEELLVDALNLSRPFAACAVKPPVSTGVLRDALLDLPLDQRAVFILRIVMSMDELDAGSIVGLPVTELRGTLFRALQGLRKSLPPNFPKERSA